MRLLVIDDEPQIVRALTAALGARGYEVAAAGNGETGLERVAAGSFDVLIVDLGLPGIDGVEVVRRVRGWSDVPIVVLSALDTEAGKVAALDAGADDYVTKPFGMEELHARLRAVTRRRADGPAPAPVLTFGEVEVDLGRRLVKRRGEPVHLTPTEYALLEAMVRVPGKLATHRWLRDKVWGGGGGEASLRVHVAQLRRKLEQRPSQPELLLTEPGLGYRWAEEPVSGDGTAPR